MKRFIALILVALTAVLLSFAASADVFQGTMVRPNTADPQLFFHNGKYYLTQTGTSRIAVFETEHVDELAELTLTSNIEYKGYLNGTVYDPAITELFGAGATISGTWSPEIHYIDEDMFGADYAGWYMFLGLRKNTGNSSLVRLVVLKSQTDSPKGPYGHPTKGTLNYSQPLLNSDGSIHDEWACGQTLLTIPEGPYKGTYTMWVSEEGRGSANGGKYGDFFQKIMIAKMKSPWQIDGTPGIVTTPTQEWEYAGASTTHPRVVEGATPVYGKNGEIFITYSGSGYWDDYGIGQLTWNGGNPLETSSWVKLTPSLGNPIFTATTATNLRGAGHASFLTDTDGNGYFCYHAYKYDYVYDEEKGTWSEEKVKASSRDAYIEPYYIDYTAWNGVSYGVIRLGINKNGVAADTASTVTFATDGEYLTSPDLYALGRTFSITLNMVEANAEGFIIYRSTDGEVFDYLATTVGSQYVDEDVTEGATYYYRAYAYREEEISPASEIVSQKATTKSPFTESATASGSTVTVTVHADDNYDTVRLYRSEDGKSYGTGIQDINNVKYGETITFTDKVSANGEYHYMATGINGGYEYFPAFTVSVEVNVPVSAPTVEYECAYGSYIFTLTPTSDYDKLALYISSNNSSFVKYNANYVMENGQCLFLIDDLKEGTYYYYATATMDGVESTPSATMTMEVIIVAPPTLKMSAPQGKITLTITATEDYDSVRILRLNENDVSDQVVVGQSGPIKAGEVYTVSDMTAICGNTYQYDAVGTVGGTDSATSNSIGHTATHYYELTEEEIPATTQSVGKTAVYSCRCGDSYGGAEIPKLEEEVTLAGDASGDDVVNILDVLRVLKAVVGMDVEINTANADINGDSKLTVDDVLAILKLSLNN
ncbi:MAG: hypothetical protein E7598_02030 [Ruminococcaceae bacterium]|nr:hypothetical protein [Oscillospiraceae bacterium]